MAFAVLTVNPALSALSAAGKPPMGFLNPFIYQNKAAFQDVTKGKNPGGLNKNYGFQAIPGWDPASGVGTPDYEALSKLV